MDDKRKLEWVSVFDVMWDGWAQLEVLPDRSSDLYKRTVTRFKRKLPRFSPRFSPPVTLQMVGQAILKAVEQYEKEC